MYVGNVGPCASVFFQNERTCVFLYAFMFYVFVCVCVCVCACMYGSMYLCVCVCVHVCVCMCVCMCGHMYLLQGKSLKNESNCTRVCVCVCMRDASLCMKLRISYKHIFIYTHIYT
jgi:hypothetical protein